MIFEDDSVALYMRARYYRNIFDLLAHDPLIQSSMNDYKRMVRFQLQHK
jgi:hypothetical protein